jgi:hypothetical protein
MSQVNSAAAIEISPTALRDQHFVMVRPPSTGYAGHVGAEAVVTDVTSGSVYVMFRSGIRDCYPPQQFLDLFRRRRASPRAAKHG